MADESDEDMMPEPCTPNNCSADPWHEILDNVEALEDAICMVGQYLVVALEHSASFIAMLQDIAGADASSLITILQPAVDERLPAILFNLYNACQWIVHIHQQLQSYPDLVAFQPLSHSVTIDFTLQNEPAPNVSGQHDPEDVHRLDMAAPGNQHD